MSDVTGITPLVIPAHLRQAQALRMEQVHQALEAGIIPIEGMAPELVGAHQMYYNQCLGDIGTVRNGFSFPGMPPLILPGAEYTWQGPPGPMVMAQMFGFPQMPGMMPGMQMPGMMGFPGMGYHMDPTLLMLFMMMQQQQNQMMMFLMMMLQQQQQQGANAQLLQLLLQLLQQQQQTPPTPTPQPEPEPEPEPTPEPEPEPEPQPQPPIREPMTLGRAAAILQANFDIVDTAAGIGQPDGVIGKQDLEAIVGGRCPNAPPELKEACEFLLANPAMLNALDTADTGEVDGRIGRSAVRAAVQTFGPLDATPDPEGPMTLGRAAAILKKYFPLLDTAAGHGGQDGKIGKNDLEAIAAAPGAPPDLRAAVEFLLNNPAMLDALDTAAGVGDRDGIIGMQDLDKAIENHPADAVGPRKEGEPMTLARAAAILHQNFDIVDTAAGIGQPDGVIGKPDLEAIVGGRAPNAPPELREACEFLLANPALLNALDTADTGEVDGRIGRTATAAAVAQFSGLDATPDAEGPMTLGRAAAILKRYFDIVDTAAGIGGRDNRIGKNDLEAIAASPGAPPDLKAAVDFLLANPAMFDALDTAAGVGDRDGIIGKQDVNVAMANHAEDAVGPRERPAEPAPTER
ncbi:MAG: hypothetical protein AB1758_04885, partial [Candidatus Eremiobacterota bacterium]